MLAPVTVKSLSRLFLPPVIGLAAGIIAESLIVAALPLPGVMAGQGDQTAAVFAAPEFVGGRYQPIHLEVRGTKEIVEQPSGLYLSRINFRRLHCFVYL